MFFISTVFVSCVLAASGPGDRYWYDLNGRPMKNAQYDPSYKYKGYIPANGVGEYNSSSASNESSCQKEAHFSDQYKK